MSLQDEISRRIREEGTQPRKAVTSPKPVRVEMWLGDEKLVDTAEPELSEDELDRRITRALHRVR